MFFKFQVKHLKFAMAPKQRMKLANEKAAKNVVQRGNVPKTLVGLCTYFPY